MHVTQGFVPGCSSRLLQHAHHLPCALQASRDPIWVHESLLPLWLIKAYEERVSACFVEQLAAFWAAGVLPLGGSTSVSCMSMG